MIEKLKTAIWFAQRPNHWAQAAELVRRKLITDLDSPDLRLAATQWAASKAVSVQVVLDKVALLENDTTAVPTILPELLKEAERLAAKAAVAMGGPGDLDLLFAAIQLSDAQKVVETGVAYGWSSLAILAGLGDREDARLASVDMPYPKMNNEDFVGIAVPERLRGKWQLIREPDRNGLRKAITLMGGAIDLCHYDSDKSYQGRAYAYPLLWQALRPGGIFISDDIQDNFAFKDFVEREGVGFAITESQGKFVGICRKPGDPVA